MNFQFNPWIDPRVEQVRMAQIESYLRRHGWARSTRKEVTPLRVFRDANLNGVFLPGIEDEEFLRHAIDAVECLARAEDRYAGDVLTELLEQASPDADGKSAATVVPGNNEAIAQSANR